MERKLSKITPVLASLLLLMLSSGYYMSFVSIKLFLQGFREEWIGLIGSCFFAGTFISPFVMGSVIQKWGLFKPFWVGLVLNAIAIILQSQWDSLWGWAFLRFFGGLIAGGYYVIVESWVLFASPRKFHSEAIALYLLAHYAGQSLGQYGLTLFDSHSIWPFVYASIFSLLAPLPLLSIREPKDTLSQVDPGGWVVLLKTAFEGVYCCLLSGFIIGAIYVLLPIYLAELAPSSQLVSMALSTTILGGMLLQWPIGKISDMFDKRQVFLIISILLVVICFFLWKNTIENIYWVSLLLFVFGAISFVLYQIALSFTCSLVGDSAIVTVSSAMVVIWGIGSVIGPPVTSFFMNIFESRVLFLIDLVLTIPLIILLIFSKWKGKKRDPHRLDG